MNGVTLAGGGGSAGAQRDIDIPEYREFYRASGN
jgi:hypothetical protein